MTNLLHFPWTITKRSLTGELLYERDIYLDISGSPDDWEIERIYYKGGRPIRGKQYVFLDPRMQLFKDIEDSLRADDTFVSVVDYELDEAEAWAA